MKMVFTMIAALVVALIAYETMRIRRLIHVSGKLVKEAHGYAHADGATSLLVLGDSTAVGVGSPADETVAGRLAREMNASTENYAVSGAITADALAQIAKAQKEHYDVVLIQIGANDIIRFHDVEKTAAALGQLLVRARTLSGHVVLLTAGKVGEAPFFPRFLGWLWTRRAARMRERFMTVAQARNIAYVDLFTAPDPFSSDPSRYYAPDNLHLTGEGYGFWYDHVRAAISAKWPQLLHG